MPGYDKVKATSARGAEIELYALEKVLCTPSNRTCPHTYIHTYITTYSTSPRNGNRANGNHLDICLSFPQKNGN